jgi:hypothetical protein
LQFAATAARAFAMSLLSGSVVGSQAAYPGARLTRTASNVSAPSVKLRDRMTMRSSITGPIAHGFPFWEDGRHLRRHPRFAASIPKA